MSPVPFGFSVRDNLFPGEEEYFKKNPKTTGMAAEDDSIILNPYSDPAVNKDAVVKNEAFRLLLRKQGLVPNFSVSPEQTKSFADTDYNVDDGALKATIAARIFSGDPSALATPEQKIWLEQFLARNK